VDAHYAPDANAAVAPAVVKAGGQQ
jgi:hypothetical protein